MKSKIYIYKKIYIKAMRNRIIAMCAALMMTANLFLPQQAGAQAPQKMSYQAVVRDASNNIVASTVVGMRIQILQGSEFGTAVYVETQTPPTNANGLVSIEIGNGTVVFGDFTTIDWTNGPFFIKTEIDPTGGTSYYASGVSQLLSVPYALHAETAETIAGGINETDPVFGASVASVITAANINNWNNKQDQLTAGTGIDITDNVISATGSVTTYEIGDFAHGGVVFWVDETGQHGLVCAKQDHGSMVRWYAGTYGNTQAKGDVPYAGAANTSIIIAAHVAIGDDGDTYAARVCNELQITEGGKTYGDWYLPSKEELILMRNNQSIIDATAIANGGSAFATSNFYYSSTEYSHNKAWIVGFGGTTQYSAEKWDPRRIRAVRAF
jgi:hypothetical protein